MWIAKIRWWQWMVISLVVGFVVAKVRQSQERPLETYGHAMNDQRAFEEGLIREHQGRRLFRDITVYPATVGPRGAEETVHLVTGAYFDGKPKYEKDGWKAEWLPTCFIARIPYKPLDAPAGAGGTSMTVVDYLDGLKDKGVTYRYAWWAEPRYQTAFWMGGSFLLIGVLWPPIVNLMTFGTFVRPREVKAPTLRAATPAAMAGPPQKDLVEVEQIGALLEAKLAADASPAAATAPGAAGDAPPPPPVKQLEGNDLVLSGVIRDEAHKEFGQKDDDFYPTERRHGHHDDDGEPRSR